jgi:hypothetical protein
VAGLQAGFAKIVAKRFPDKISSRKKSGQTYRGRSFYFDSSEEIVG